MDSYNLERARPGKENIHSHPHMDLTQPSLPLLPLLMFCMSSALSSPQPFLTLSRDIFPGMEALNS